MMSVNALSKQNNRFARAASGGARKAKFAAPTPNVRAPREFKFFALVTLLHLPLGLALYNSSAIALLHPWLVLSVGLYFAVQNKPDSFVNTAYVAAYMTGAEVLWRMAEAPIFWEFGKYGVALILIVALWRKGGASIPALPLVFLALLVPSCLITLSAVSAGEARGMLSFNMSGPFALVVCCCFFYNVRLDWQQLRQLLLWLVIPVISVACTTLFYIVSAPVINFGTESNVETSGGFGPNQVSSILGMGVFATVFCLVSLPNSSKLRFFLAGATIFLAAQSVLTFSRGGMYNAVGALLAVVFLQISNAQARKRIVPIIAICAIFLILVFPFLNNFTGGALQDRFEDTGTTRRTDIIESDIQILADNPIFGVGVGIAKGYRKQKYDFSAASHTEFSRLIAEHGAFGIFALLALFAMFFFNFQKQPTRFGKALAAGAVIWSSLFMMNAGMRLVAPAFVIGLSFVTIVFAKSAKKHLPLKPNVAAAPPKTLTAGLSGN